jgi:myo-inositol-1(or 4)-monophosphatase
VQALIPSQFDATLDDAGILQADGKALVAHVAARRFNAFYEPHMHPWDASAGLLLIEDAGGRVAPYPGSHGLLAGGEVLASTPALFDSLAALVRG